MRRKTRCALVVDQNVHLRALLRDELRALRYGTIVLAGSLLDALEQAQMIAFDIALVGQKVGLEQGCDFIRRVRLDPFHGNRKMPIIVLADTATRSVIHAARDCGANALLVKPFSRASLSTQIERAMSDARPFVESDSYFGPDRRTRRGAFFGPERRQRHDAYYVA